MRKIFKRIGLLGATCIGLVVCGITPVHSQTAAGSDGKPAPSSAQTEDETTVIRLMSALGDLGQRLNGQTDAHAVAEANLKQAEIIRQILAHAHGAERQTWINQLIDCLHVAALNSQAGDQIAYQQLVEVQAELAQKMPNSPLAAYAAHCQMEVEHVTDLNQPNSDFIKVQERWRKKLAAFVKKYPDAKETPETVMELATVSESLNHNTDAKRCYGYLVEHYPDNALAVRARGALNRLQLDGQTLKLGLPLLYTEDRRYDVPFDIDQLRGRVTVVYFWSSHESQSVQDLNTLKQLMDRYHSLGLELLCVNLDKTPEEARHFLHGERTAGVDVFQRGGIDGPASLQYGLVSLPTAFLIGKDGKVVNRDIQMGTLDQLVAKHLSDPMPENVVKPTSYIGSHWPWTR